MFVYRLIYRASYGSNTPIKVEMKHFLYNFLVCMQLERLQHCSVALFIFRVPLTFNGRVMTKINNNELMALAE